MDEARALAQTLAAKPPVAVRYILDAVAGGLEMSLADAQDYEATLFGLVSTTDDMREGTRAFLEKRKPASRAAERASADVRIALVVSDVPRLRHRPPRSRARGRSSARPASPTVTSRRSRCPARSSWRRRRMRLAESGRVAARSCAWAASSAARRRTSTTSRRRRRTASCARRRRPACRCVFGVLTTNTAEEAMARAGDGDDQQGPRGRGRGIEMARLYAAARPRRRRREYRRPASGARGGAAGALPLGSRQDVAGAGARDVLRRASAGRDRRCATSPRKLVLRHGRAISRRSTR